MTDDGSSAAHVLDRLTPPRAVLVSRDLLKGIVLFQEGLHVDILHFARAIEPFRDVSLADYDCTREVCPSTGITMPSPLVQLTGALTTFHDFVTAWYREFGPSRLNKVFACYPTAEDVVVAHAVFTGDRTLLTDHLEIPTIWHVLYPLLDLAALQGHMSIVEFLHEVVEHDGCSTWAMDCAAQCGRLEIVRYLHENRIEGCTEVALVGAAARGFVPVVEFLHTNCDFEAGDIAAAVGAAAKANHAAIVALLTDLMAAPDHRPDTSSTSPRALLARNDEHVETMSKRR